MLKLIRDNRMRHERRPLLLKPEQVEWQHDGDTITVSFALPAGCFATAVVREMMQEIVDETEGTEHDAYSDQ
ncbi:tRNA pseudouridine 13 synthase [Photobacterium aphoticum]|uniref:tRNA pseudouridine 13 synthase n=1 Tax=Photobacterium aphoticum TaxID=754436 RepID=A0A090R154_9GAMM|nr:tRNA pseudouridine 13 synthase [Photobacterium aphoticum]